MISDRPLQPVALRLLGCVTQSDREVCDLPSSVDSWLGVNDHVGDPFWLLEKFSIFFGYARGMPDFFEVRGIPWNQTR